jgi:hypothetical protein
VVAQSAFFWLSRHGCEPFLLRATGPQSELSRNRGSVAARASFGTEAGCEYPEMIQTRGMSLNLPDDEIHAVIAYAPR